MPTFVAFGRRNRKYGSRVDSDVASRVNYSSVVKYIKKEQDSVKKPEAAVQESPGTSNIESVPCTPSSNIQFMASEITSLQDPHFGTLEESGMGQFSLPPLAEETSNESQDVACGNEEETVASTNDSTSTVVSADVIAPKSKNNTQPKSTNRQGLAKAQDGSESERIIKYMVSQQKLDSVIDRLESVSNKLTAATVGDQYEQFGKYVGSLLRGMPIKKVNSLKKKILADVMAAVEGRDRDPPCLKSTGTQVGLDVLATEKAYKKFITEQSQTKSLSADSKSTTNNTNVLHFSNNGNNIPILGGNMPLIFPGVSTSTASFKLLPVIPMSGSPSMPVMSMSGSPSMPVLPISATHSMPVIPKSATPSMVSTATVVTTPSLRGSITSVHSVSMPPSETLTTVASSAGGTLLAVTIPKSQMSETPVGPKQSSLQTPRGQKRKQTTTAYLIKKVPCPSGASTQTVIQSGQDCGLVNQTDSGRKKKGSSQTWEDLRDSGGGEVTICNSQPTRQTVELSQSQGRARDSGKEMGVANVQSIETDVEYEIDIEEGNELLRIKQDHDLFETVMCGESPSYLIKEEAPDPEETEEDCLNSATETITPPATLTCTLCSSQCNSREDLERHFSTSHPGNVPPAKDDSGAAIL